METYQIVRENENNSVITNQRRHLFGALTAACDVDDYNDNAEKKWQSGSVKKFTQNREKKINFPCNLF